ncbi:MAG: AMIN-like domain-containing (lipo)protein [Acidimicrobiales bacterium]
MRRWIALLAAAVAATAFGLVSPAVAAPEPYCGIRWGSLPEIHDEMSSASLVNVRAGRHPCFDRLVLDLRGRADGYRVEYVSTVRSDGSGQVVPLRGGAKLQVVALAPAYDDSGNSTYRPANQNELVNVAGWSTFRQVASAGSFEGQTTMGLGVRARLPFRVFTLDGPGNGSRIVIDVAHHW